MTPTLTAGVVGKLCWVEWRMSNPLDVAAPLVDALTWTLRGNDSHAVAITEGGMVAAGLARLDDMGHELGSPGTAPVGPGWYAFLHTNDVDVTCRAVVELGGSVLSAPAVKGRAGVDALVADSGGTVIGLWQPIDHLGWGASGPAGTCVSIDLFSPEPHSTRRFLYDLGSDGAGYSVLASRTPFRPARPWFAGPGLTSIVTASDCTTTGVHGGDDR